MEGDPQGPSVPTSECHPLRKCGRSYALSLCPISGRRDRLLQRSTCLHPVWTQSSAVCLST
jgi:hypothetical protein